MSVSRRVIAGGIDKIGGTLIGVVEMGLLLRVAASSTRIALIHLISLSSSCISNENVRMILILVEMPHSGT